MHGSHEGIARQGSAGEAMVSVGCPFSFEDESWAFDVALGRQPLTDAFRAFCSIFSRLGWLPSHSLYFWWPLATATFFRPEMRTGEAYLTSFHCVLFLRPPMLQCIAGGFS